MRCGRSAVSPSNTDIFQLGENNQSQKIALLMINDCRVFHEILLQVKKYVTLHCNISIKLMKNSYSMLIISILQIVAAFDEVNINNIDF